jgi:hypothetical protein
VNERYRGLRERGRPPGWDEPAAGLQGVASVAGLAGIGVLCAALIAAMRQWYRRVDLAPRQLANLKWQQARAAIDASTGAWRDVEKSAYSPRSSNLMQ